MAETSTPTAPEVLIVGNPFSGMRGNVRRAGRLEEALKSLGVPARIVWDREERRRLLARPDLARTCRCVVVAGGDGTVGDVINESSGAPLAVLPLGTENLLGRYLGFARDWAVSARAIARAHHRRLDLGLLTTGGAGAVASRRFSLMVSAGLDADVVHRMATWRHADGKTRRVQRFSYVTPIFAALSQYTYGRVEVEADGQRAVGTSAMVFNLPCYGLNLGLRRDAVGDDGLLDWITFDRVGTVAAIGYFLSVLRGQHMNRADVRHGRAKSVRMSSATPVPIQVDGDAAGFTPAEIEVLPGALTVIETRGSSPV